MKKGWEVIDMWPSSRTYLNRAIKAIQYRLLTHWGIDGPLENYKEEKRHEEIQFDLAKVFIDGRYGNLIIRGSLYEFMTRIGMDLHIQKYPYFRIARPGRAEDNIGIHRDTKYGGTPYEISCVIPLTTMPPSGSLHVIDGSHVAPERDFPFKEEKTDVVKGSEKHKLGFVYNKKNLGELKTHPVEVKVGQMLAFPLSLVHGQEINNSDIARFSVDIRLVNSMAPIAWTHTVHADYWEVLCASEVSGNAQEYYKRQHA